MKDYLLQIIVEDTDIVLVLKNITGR